LKSTSKKRVDPDILLFLGDKISSMDLDSIRKTYERLPDFKIVHIAQYESNQISPEALQILKDEIKKRGLDKSLNHSIEVNENGISESAFNEVVERIRKTPCPYCNTTLESNTAVWLKNHTGASHVSVSETFARIGCKTCLLGVIKKVSNMSVATGIWSISGIWKTSQALDSNDDMRVALVNDKTELFLKQAIYQNIGAFISKKDNQLDLIEFLKFFNTK
jgi:hypothetical protein